MPVSWHFNHSNPEAEIRHEFVSSTGKIKLNLKHVTIAFQEELFMYNIVSKNSFLNGSIPNCSKKLGQD